MSENIKAFQFEREKLPVEYLEGLAVCGTILTLSQVADKYLIVEEGYGFLDCGHSAIIYLLTLRYGLVW